MFLMMKIISLKSSDDNKREKHPRISGIMKLIPLRSEDNKKKNKIVKTVLNKENNSSQNFRKQQKRTLSKTV